MKVKLICLNVWSGGRLFDNIKKFIAEEQADLVALQEVYHAETYPPEQPWHVVSELASILGYEHYAFAPAMGKVFNDGRRVQQGNAILSRWPFQSSRVIFYDQLYNGVYPETPGDYRYTPRNLQHAEVLIGKKLLHVCNTQGIWGFDGDDHERRLAMGETIAREIAGKQPLLLTGDFNAQEGTKTIQKIETHVRSIFKGELTTSFNMRHKTTPGFATAIVDMMFASPDISVIGHRVAEADVSDHLALIGEFEIP